MDRIQEPFGAFSKSEDGGMTVLGLYVTVAMFILGGLAVDVSSLIASRTQLQVAADMPSHAALYSREMNSADVAREQALDLVQTSFPSGGFGELLNASSISFGTYDKETQTFTVDNTSRQAVYVETGRLSSKGSAVTSLLMQFAGFSDWDVITPSVFEVYRPWCLRDGWVAEGVVDSQSNNMFESGFCVHSNTHVEVNSGSIFEDGVTVSAPNGYEHIVLPNSGWESNAGLLDAVTDAYIPMRILSQLDTIHDGLYDDTSEYFRDYITNVTPIALIGIRFTPADFTPGRIHTLTCDPGTFVTINASLDVLSNVVIDTDCQIKFGKKSVLENVVIFNTNTLDDSFKSARGLRLGADDNCNSDGSVQLVTFGGFSAPADLEIYGSQVLAKGPIQFAAKADGVQGGSFISGEYIDATSNTTMGVCPNDAGEVFEVDLFRLAG